MTHSPKTYSPFWAIAIVFLTFVFLQTVNVKGLLDQRTQLEATRAQMQKVVPQALNLNQTVEKLGHDLLSMTNKEARQIVADFKIAPTAKR